MLLTYRRYDMDLRDERELALQRLRVLCHSGLFSIVDFRYFDVTCLTSISMYPMKVCYSFALSPADIIL